MLDKDIMGSYTKTYSCLFEVELPREKFGLSREEHNYLCNQELLILLISLKQNGIRFCSYQTNDELINYVSHHKHRSPLNFVWEHCSSSTAGGRIGVMRLVPKTQHHPRSSFWKRIHPDYKNRGGYHEWAKPAGAPSLLLKEDAQQLQNIDLSLSANAPKEMLYLFLKKAVLTNNLSGVQKIVLRFSELDFTHTQIRQIIQQTCTLGAQKRETTLLHEAIKNGYEPIFKVLFNFIDRQTVIKVDGDGNSLAHIAALYNRPGLLQLLLHTQRHFPSVNKHQKAIYDILITRNFTKSLFVYEQFQIKNNDEILLHSRKCKTPRLEFFSNKSRSSKQTSLFNPFFSHKTKSTHSGNFLQTLRGITTCLKHIGKW